MFDPTWRVPRSRATQTHETMRAAILAALEPMLFESMQAGYDARERLEREFAAAMGQPNDTRCVAVALHSGTIALMIALRACGIGAGDDVMTVGNSDISTTAAIRQCGARPILCDVRVADYTLDVDQIAARITPQTRAILPVDLHGHPADVRALREIADQHGLMIVEDAALATGARDHGVPVGAFADAAVFSFAPFKPLGSAGNGAMLVTRNPDIERRARLLTGYGHDPDSDGLTPGHQRYLAEGYNAPLDALEAALLTVKLPYLETWTAARRRIAAGYQAGLAGTAARCPSFRAESEPTFRSYTICVPRRAHVYAGLRAAGIEVVLHYTPPAYRHPVYGGALPGSDALPITDRLANELICLPVTPELTDDEIAYVVATVSDLLAGERG
jgi:dTDP-4-amino-4,6-dideoxygalactose transaminase